MSNLPSVRFIYFYCQDLAAMRHFYSELIGLKETYFSEDDRPSVAYDCDGLQFTIYKSDNVSVTPNEYALQPGWLGGTKLSVSWSIPVPSGDYAKTISKLQASSVDSFSPGPKWVGYWSFPVLDPMGNTVEVVTSPPTEPENKEWPSN